MTGCVRIKFFFVDIDYLNNNSFYFDFSYYKFFFIDFSLLKTFIKLKIRFEKQCYSLINFIEYKRYNDDIAHYWCLTFITGSTHRQNTLGIYIHNMYACYYHSFTSAWWAVIKHSILLFVRILFIFTLKIL